MNLMWHYKHYSFDEILVNGVEYIRVRDKRSDLPLLTFVLCCAISPAAAYFVDFAVFICLAVSASCVLILFTLSQRRLYLCRGANGLNVRYGPFATPRSPPMLLKGEPWVEIQRVSILKNAYEINSLNGYACVLNLPHGMQTFLAVERSQEEIQDRIATSSVLRGMKVVRKDGLVKELYKNIF